MKGLEITVLPLSKVCFDNRVFRIDPQYFAKTALVTETQIKRGQWEDLSKAATKIESFGAYALTNEFAYVEEGVPFLRCLNIRDGFTEFNDVLYITPEANTLLFKSEVKPEMVLLTMSGTVGNTTVALQSWKYPINSNQDVAKITPGSEVSPYYLAAFFGSRFGQAQMNRLPVGSVQQHIFLWMIERIPVPRFSPQFEDKVGDIVKAAFRMDAESVAEIENAERTLLEALGLVGRRLPDPLTYTRLWSEAVAAKRLDPAYFAPRVTEIIAHLSIGGKSIDDVAPPRREFFVRTGNGEFDYIEINDIRSDGSVTAERLSQDEAPSRAKWVVRSGDVITSTVRPIRRLSALITPDQDGFVCSSGFIVLEPKAVSSEVLLLYLRLAPICELMDLHTSASLYPAIGERDLLRLPFRPISEGTERDLVNSVRRAQSNRQRSRLLIAHARTAVEIAIQEHENAAMKFISNY